MPRLDYGRVHLVELPVVPINACEKLKHSFDALSQGEQRHRIGQYDDAVGKCRVALEPFFEWVDKPDGQSGKAPRLKKSWETRLGKSTYDWLEGSFRAIKEASNANHHSPVSHYDQFESQMIIAITTAVIAYAARSDT